MSVLLWGTLVNVKLCRPSKFSEISSVFSAARASVTILYTYFSLDKALSLSCLLIPSTQTNPPISQTPTHSKVYSTMKS